MLSPNRGLGSRRGLDSVVFLEAWRKRKEVRVHTLLPWLYGVATNVLRNRSRSLRRYRAALARMPVDHEADFADAAAERIDDEQQMRRVLDAFRFLPKRDQDVLALCVWSGLSDQTCERLGLADLSAQGEAESRRFVQMRDAIYARLGNPPSGSSRRSGLCVGEERARAIVLEELAAHGYPGWKVTTAGEAFTAERPCAVVSLDSGSKTALLLAGMRN